MHKLNFPSNFTFNIQTVSQKKLIFDKVRKKDVPLTPEEWVRQHLIHYLIDYKACPEGLIAVERKIVVNGLDRRPDVVVYSKNAEPWMVCECKRPEEKLDNRVLKQAANYNMVHKAKYLMVTNGLEHFVCEINHEEGTYKFVDDLPSYGN